MVTVHSINLILFLSSVINVLSQDCVTVGNYCSDDDACCGGCCRNSICTSTYESCNINEDLCLEHYCPPGLECYVYKPDCMGCDLTTDCRSPQDNKSY